MNAKAIYEKYCNNAKPVIDIGCGWWPIFDFDYVRFDKANIILGRKTCANHYGDFHDMSDFADNTFAFVSAKDIIEHAKYPEKALKEWTRILQPGGILYLVYPALFASQIKDNNTELLQSWENALNNYDLEKYSRLGGDMSWVSTDIKGNFFLDAHWSIPSIEQMKIMLPKSLIVLEEYDYGCLILQKEL